MSAPSIAICLNFDVPRARARAHACTRTHTHAQTNTRTHALFQQSVIIIDSQTGPSKNFWVEIVIGIFYPSFHSPSKSF